jgi:hypothetical protein
MFELNVTHLINQTMETPTQKEKHPAKWIIQKMYWSHNWTAIQTIMNIDLHPVVAEIFWAGANAGVLRVLMEAEEASNRRRRTGKIVAVRVLHGSKELNLQ